MFPPFGLVERWRYLMGKRPGPGRASARRARGRGRRGGRFFCRARQKNWGDRRSWRRSFPHDKMAPIERPLPLSDHHKDGPVLNAVARLSNVAIDALGERTMHNLDASAPAGVTRKGEDRPPAGRTPRLVAAGLGQNRRRLARSNGGRVWLRELGPAAEPCSGAGPSE